MAFRGCGKFAGGFCGIRTPLSCTACVEPCGPTQRHVTDLAVIRNVTASAAAFNATPCRHLHVYYLHQSTVCGVIINASVYRPLYIGVKT